MRKAIVYITEEMEDAHSCCCEDSDCNECPCQIGTDDCVFNYKLKKMWGGSNDSTGSERNIRVLL
jgi:hypothetical protein